MKHIGDIMKINGAEIEPVDVITGGSPCRGILRRAERRGKDLPEMLKAVQRQRNGALGERDRRVSYRRDEAEIRRGVSA